MHVLRRLTVNLMGNLRVIPAQAGIQPHRTKARCAGNGIAALAGMTELDSDGGTPRLIFKCLRHPAE
jgi:hypothetical protein